MKSNAALWETVSDVKQLIDDLNTMTTKQLCDKYQTSSRRIYVACKHFGIDTTALKSVGNIIYKLPNKELLELQLKQGKIATARYFGCTVPVVNRWIKFYNMTIEPFQGKVIDLGYDELKSYIDQGMTDREIARKTGFSKAKILRQGKRFNLQIVAQSELWEQQRQQLNNKFEWICEENKTRDILSIANELQYTHSTVLKFLKEKGHTVISHSCNKSKGELEVRDFIRSLGFECKSVKLTHKGVTREIDCFIEEVQVGIEYCGEYWHSDINKPKNYHSEKVKWCEEQGIQLITIFANEWLTKQNLIKSMLTQKVGKTPTKYFARNLQIKEIDSYEANRFYNENHIQGALPNIRISLALVLNDTIISVMSFINSRFDKTYQWEIGRFATSKNTVVIGGASKLFTHFVKQYHPENCVSFCDLRYGTGKVYTQMGFTFTKKTTPGYFYFHKPTGVSYSRFKFQKHKLNKELKVFDPNLSEYDNMALNNYLRIWDCGNSIYTWIS